MVKTKKKLTTIRSYISAIKAVLWEEGIELNENRSILNSLTRACHIRNDKIRIKLPIKKPMLQLLMKSLIKTYPGQPYLVTLYRAMLATIYFGSLELGK